MAYLPQRLTAVMANRRESTAGGWLAVCAIPHPCLLPEGEGVIRGNDGRWLAVCAGPHPCPFPQQETSTREAAQRKSPFSWRRRGSSEGACYFTRHPNGGFCCPSCPHAFTRRAPRHGLSAFGEHPDDDFDPAVGCQAAHQGRAGFLAALRNSALLTQALGCYLAAGYAA